MALKKRKLSLRREAGLLQVVAYGVGNIIGAGIYVLVGAASGLAGGAIWFAFLLGAIVALFTGLSYAELSSMYPKAASEYVFLGKAFGNHLLSFTTEWMMLATEIVATAAVSLGFAGYFQSVYALPIWLVAAGLLLMLTFVAILGIKGTLKLNLLFSAVAVIGLLIVIGAGAPKLGSIDYTFSPGGFSGIIGAAILVFFAYIGFDNIANLAEETKDPTHTLPKALLIAVAVTTVLYVLTAIAAVSLTPLGELSTSKAPLALAASKALGPVAYDVLTFAALITTLNTVMVLLITASRIIFGMAREGALPRQLGYVSKRTGAPYAASILVLVIALAFLPLGKVDIVARITSFGSLATFFLVNIALLHLRKAVPNLKRPFRTPLNVGWISITAVIGAGTCFALLTQFDAFSVMMGLLLPLSGIMIFLAFHRNGNALEIDRALHENHKRGA